MDMAVGKTRESGKLGLERCKCCMNEWKNGSLSCSNVHCVVLKGDFERQRSQS